MSDAKKTLMGQKDILLKLAMQKYFWRLDYSTIINVPLRAYHSKQRGTSSAIGYEEFTDLDVLGIDISREARVEMVIGDCKTSERRSTERMFWLKGVAHFFDARTAYLVRSKDVTQAARQLAARLDLSVITEADFDALLAIHPGDSSIRWDALDSLASIDLIEREEQLLRGLEKPLFELVDYLRSDYWVYDSHRNLVQLIAHLNESARHLDHRHPSHRSLFLRAATLYALSLCDAVSHIRSGHLRALEVGLDEYFSGGPISLLERRKLAQLLQHLAPSGYNRDLLEPFPPYYNALKEHVTRLVRRSESLRRIVQYSEFARLFEIDKRSFHPVSIFGPSYDAIAVKLLVDTCNFLINAAQLDVRWKSVVERYAITMSSADSGTAVPAGAPLTDRPVVNKAEVEEIEKPLLPFSGNPAGDPSKP